ncbi:PilN domain-containing protein [Pseudogemmatithrix spongiicola]|uniref:PilN domain-containing protein n=1 Tax=Pseudogemmatithrix spongiicola TaxID=3062599 RepID=A0AA49JW80_9BACT|nr:PilN domain-containing protein [Gemmatimonadaceae bacterium 'strain 138']WKW15945.1 PilN domain-containing protein [Gemmatimonadaceae bacterium 'strain 318']
MIEINLLPGARRKKGASKGASINVGALLEQLRGRFKDPWLMVAVGGLLLGVAITGFMWYSQNTKTADLAERERIAVQDSTRYAAVLAQRSAAEAQRDSLLRQIAIISAIDGDRFVWPHVLDEVARALPTYTWLRQLQQSNQTAAASPEDVAANGGGRVAIRILAYTVDLQAVTIFMKNLEASPFLENVVISSSESATVDGKDVHQFQLDLMYQKPDSTAIRTVPLSIAVR